jgi:hypothetical protein
MEKFEQIKKMLETTGFPVAYLAFPEDNAPSMPFLVYEAVSSNNFAADGMVYQKIIHFQIDLYTDKKDLNTEDKVEQALSSFFWQKTGEYNDTERVFRTIYEIEV